MINNNEVTKGVIIMKQVRLCAKCGTRDRFDSGRCRTCRLNYLEENAEKLELKRIEDKANRATYQRAYYADNKDAIKQQRRNSKYEEVGND